MNSNARVLRNVGWDVFEVWNVRIKSLLVVQLENKKDEMDFLTFIYEHVYTGGLKTWMTTFPKCSRLARYPIASLAWSKPKTVLTTGRIFLSW